MQQPSISDVVGLFIFAMSLFFSREVANMVAPYLVIVVAASTGASFALARKEKTTRLAGFWYFLRVCGLAILITAGVAAFVASYNESLTSRILIAPIAFMIGFIGDDLPDIGRKVIDYFVDRFSPNKAKND
jgi:uncharacterized membrane protein YiaA